MSSDTSPLRKGPSGPKATIDIPTAIGAKPIVWRPDGLGDAKTWDEVMALKDSIGDPVQIFCPQKSTGVPPSLVYVIPPGSGSVTYEMGQSWLTGPLGPHDAIQIQLQRGATLRGLAGLSGGIRLQANKQPGDPPGIVPVPLSADVASVFAVERGATLTNLANAAAPIIKTVTQTESYIVFSELGTAESKSGGTAVVELVSQSLLHVVALAGGLSLDTFQPPGWIGGPADSQLEWMHDGSMAMSTNFWTQNAPGLASVQLNTPVGNVGGSGPTAFRPTFQGGGQPSVGCMFLDTSLGANGGLPIWWTGTNWVDATGAIA